MTLAPTTTPSAPDLASRRRWSILAVIAIAQLMVVLDNTIVNIALPSAQLDLGFTDPHWRTVWTDHVTATETLLAELFAHPELAEFARIVSIRLIEAEFDAHELDELIAAEQ